MGNVNVPKSLMCLLQVFVTGSSTRTLRYFIRLVDTDIVNTSILHEVPTVLTLRSCPKVR